MYRSALSSTHLLVTGDDFGTMLTFEDELRHIGLNYDGRRRMERRLN